MSKNFDTIYQNLKQTLFQRKTQIPFNRGRREAINKLKILNKNQPEYKDYLEDLIMVVEKLDALPEHYAKHIRGISLKRHKKELSILQTIIPHSYLIDIIEKANKVEEGEECLILSEELT